MPGFLLLGKACLVKKAYTADPKEALSKQYIPKLTDSGKVIIVPNGNYTVDIQGIKDRFKTFGLSISMGNIWGLHIESTRFDNQTTSLSR